MNFYLNHTKNNPMVRSEKGILLALETGFLLNSALRTGRVFREGANFKGSFTVKYSNITRELKNQDQQ